MLFELTVFATFALHHVLIGACLSLALAALFIFIDPGPELESWLWTTAFIICALAPFAAFVPESDEQPVNIEHPAPAEPDRQPAGKDAGAPDTAPAPPVRGVPYRWNVPGEWIHTRETWLVACLWIWLAGGLWRGFGVVRAFRRTRQLRGSAVPYERNDTVTNTSRYPVLVSRQAQAPMAVGPTRPAIVLPRSFVERFDEQRLTPIILHEQAHIQRGDLWVGVFQELIAIVFWWSPVMRVLNRKIHIARELACDMRAAGMLDDGRRYARSLVDCAELMLTGHHNVMAMGLFSKKKDLTKRINHVLKLKTAKTPTMYATLAACTVFAAAGLAVTTEYAPRISLAAVKQEANYYSTLPREQGEKLIRAVRDNDMQTITVMLDKGLDIDTPVLGEGTALIEAVRTGNRPMVEFLIQAGADVDQPALGYGNPMIAAARGNQLELARLLYEQGANLDAAVERDGTPLVMAIRFDHDAMAKKLIEWGADVNRGVKYDGNPMINAAIKGNLDMVKRLFDAGADVNGVVETDETPLINAARHGHFEVVKFLVENGADVNLGVKADGEYRTPLNMAHNAMLRDYLIGRGAEE